MSTFTITRQSAWSLLLRSLLARHPLVSYFVRNHVSNIFAKLQVADRAQAIIRARIE